MFPRPSPTSFAVLVVLSLAGIRAASSAESWPDTRAGAVPAMDRLSEVAAHPPPLDSVGSRRSAERAVRWEAPTRRSLSLLDDAAAVIPGDDWVVGHRVGFRVALGDLAHALADALDCEGARWWCEMLTGYVLHHLGWFPEAEAAFDRALRAMPSRERCDWADDLRWILHRGVDGALRGLECEERFEVELRMWRLADPLWTRPGNDRRTEHFARMVGMRLHHEYLALDQSHCTTAHHQDILSSGAAGLDWPYRRGHFHAGTGYGFVPDHELFSQPHRADPSAWTPTLGSGGERYDPPYGPIHPLPHQVGIFRRGGDIRIAAAAEMARHPLAIEAPFEYGLVLADVGDARPILTSEPYLELLGRAVWDISVPADAYLVGIEAIGEWRGGARARFGRSPPELRSDGTGISDVIFFDRAGSLPSGLDDVLPKMLGTEEILPGREVGIFWEMYGLEAESVAVRLSVTHVEPGFARRIGEALRILRTPPGIRTAWREPLDPGERAYAPRSIHVDLAALEPGSYLLEVEVEGPAGAGPVRARREFTVPEVRGVRR